MPEPDELSLFASRFEAIGTPYMITGATAAILYGQPRVTNDLDVVLTLDDAGRSALLRVFPETEFYVPPETVILAEQRATSAATSTSSTTKAATKPTSTWSVPTPCMPGPCPFADVFSGVIPSPYPSPRRNTSYYEN